VFDRNAVAGQDDALHKQARKSLAVQELELLKTFAKRGCESLDVFSKLVDSPVIECVCSKLTLTCTVHFERQLEALTSRLELLHLQSTALIGVDESLDLHSELTVSSVYTRAFTRQLRNRCARCAPAGDFLAQHLRALQP